MKEAMKLHLEETDKIPQSKGFEFYLKQELLNKKNISKEYLISNIEVQKPNFAG